MFAIILAAQECITEEVPTFQVEIDHLKHQL
jgi:hypothetical protein